MLERRQALNSLSTSDWDVRNIIKTGASRKFKKKSTIFNQGDDSDSVYFIQSGKVKVFVTDESGRVTILRLLSAGEYFGELGLIDIQPRSATVETLEDTQLKVVSEAKFREYLRINPELALKLILQLTTRIRDLTSELMISRTKNAYSGFRSKLYDLAIKQADSTLLIEQKFTMQDFAELVGTTRENISRFISGLKQGGYLTKSAEGQWLILKTLPLNW